jgi:hypothetical protein
MKPREMSSLDTVEMVMAFEEALDIEVSGDIGRFETARQIVDRLETVLSNRRPNKAAAALLRQIAKDRQQPELAEGLDGPWRREQIAAIVREVFRAFD